MKKKYLYLQWCVVSIVSLGLVLQAPVSARGDEVKVATTDSASVENVDGWGMCTDKKLGIRFLCNPEWKVQLVENAILIIISAKPDVTLIVTKLDTSITFLSQLTKAMLKEKNRYIDGFRTENIKLFDRDAIKVKAFSMEYPDRRLLDYYFMHNSNLYAILFSVNPKEEMEEYKFLLKKIINSFNFFETETRNENSTTIDRDK